MLVIPQSALVLMLARQVRQDRTLRLYVNAQTPTPLSVRGDFTEAHGAGYAPVTLVPERWEIDSATGLAMYPKIVFTFTAPLGAVHGYFVTGPTGALEWVEQFDHGPYEMREPDDQIKVTPRYAFGLGDEALRERTPHVAHAR